MPSAEASAPARESGYVHPKIPLVVIIGPTAVGKTAIAIQLAERLDGEIVSADSRLFYRGMDIGTAKPTVQDQARVPHHLIDVAEPDENWNLALFQSAANKVIEQIYARRHLPFLVGGTGQFVHAVIEGWRIPPAAPDLRLREALNHLAMDIGGGALHGKLALLDPAAAQAIDPTNIRRTVRALEVILSTGKRFSVQKSRGNLLYAPLLLGLSLPQVELYQRIDDRITSMLEQGFAEEVRLLLDKGYSPNLATMSAIGYGEMVSYLHGKITLEQAIASMKRRTRVFVRRQANWFKHNNPEIHWFPINQGTVKEMQVFITDWLGSSNLTGTAMSPHHQ
jgi:tRNA dimethylallyltransferase